MNFPTAATLQCAPAPVDELSVALHENKPIETIRLSDDQKQRLVKQVNDHYHKPVPKERREMRVPYLASGAAVTVLQPNGSTTRHAVLSRNISCGGLSFMIGRFIYPDCEALVHLPQRAGGVATLPGRTIRCNHFSGMIHECAVTFNEPIDLERFVDLDPCGERAALGTAAAAALAKEDAPLILIVEEHKSDRRLYKLWLEKLGFEAIEAESAAAAQGLMRSNPIELALVSSDSGGGEALGLIKAMRTGGFGGPLLAVSADHDPAARTHARGAGADEYLLKPFDQADLRHAIERLMAQTAGDDGGGEAVRSELAANESMKPLLLEFVAGLGDTARKLASAAAAEDCDAIAQLCRRLKGSGSGYGFPQVTQLSVLVLDQLDMEQRDITAVREALDELVMLLKRVKAD